MLKIPYAGCPGLSQVTSAQFTLKCVLQPKIAKKSLKPLFWGSRSFKVVDLDVNRKGIWNFLLMINGNLGPISHRF